MWPGWSYKLHKGQFLNIRSVHQIIRMENVLEKLLIIRELSLDQSLDYQEEILKVFKGIKVMSHYNNKIYFIQDICFDMNTESTFELTHDGERFEVSFFDYFTKRYNQTITQKKQPMIKATNSLKGENSQSYCYLVTELCYLVGMTDSLRNRKMTWREIKQVIRVDAPKKIDHITSLIHKLFSKKESLELIDKWGIQLDKKPAKHKGYKLDPGNLTMGQPVGEE